MNTNYEFDDALATIACRAGSNPTSEHENSDSIFATSSFRFENAAQAAARFSFLLSIPIILATGFLKGVELATASGASIQWLVMFYGAIVSALVAYICIHFFLQLIEKIGFLPFVVYRVVLGLFLLFLAL